MPTKITNEKHDRKIYAKLESFCWIRQTAISFTVGIGHYNDIDTPQTFFIKINAVEILTRNKVTGATEIRTLKYSVNRVNALKLKLLSYHNVSIFPCNLA